MPKLAGYAVAADPDGGVEVLAIAQPSASDGEFPAAVWYARQKADDDWSGRSLGHPAIGNLGSGISVASNPDGHLEAVVASTEPPGESSNTVWHAWQIHPGGDWSSWRSLENPDHGSTIFNPVLAQDDNGRLELFASVFESAVWHRWQGQPGHGPWKGWQSLGDPVTEGGCIQAPAVARNRDGRLEVFTLAGGALWHCWQTAANNGWSGWSSLNTPSAQSLGSPVLARNHDGRLAVFTISSDAAWHRTQHEPGRGPWEPWTSLGPHPVGSFTDLAAGAHADGRLVLFAIADKPQGGTAVLQLEQHTPGDWASAVWQPVDTLPNVVQAVSNPVLISGSDGRLSLFLQITRAEHPDWPTVLYVRRQQTPNDSKWGQELVNLQALSKST